MLILTSNHVKTASGNEKFTIKSFLLKQKRIQNFF